MTCSLNKAGRASLFCIYLRYVQTMIRSSMKQVKLLCFVYIWDMYQYISSIKQVWPPPFVYKVSTNSDLFIMKQVYLSCFVYLALCAQLLWGPRVTSIQFVLLKMDTYYLYSLSSPTVVSALMNWFYLVVMLLLRYRVEEPALLLTRDYVCAIYNIHITLQDCFVCVSTCDSAQAWRLHSVVPLVHHASCTLT